MDYRDTVFLTVAEQLNFSRAAEELHISQPAVTKHIKELERKLDTALFERKGHRVYLTKSGELVYEHLKKIKRQYSDMQYELGRLREAFEGKLLIGASSSISQYLLPPAIAAFNKRYPSIQLSLYNGNSTQMEKKLLEHHIDIAMVENASSHPDIQYLDWMEDEIVVITGINSPYAKQSSLHIKDLQKIPIVLREKGSGTLEVIKKNFEKHQLNWEELPILLELGSTEAIKSFLNDFDGIALLTEKAIEKELQLKRIVRLEVKGLTIRRQFRIALRKGPTLKIPQLFIDFLSNLQVNR